MRRPGPVATLVLLAPVVAELLPGFTRISVSFVLIPEIGVWGCGALLIREVVRRRGLGGTSLLLLGVALAVAEECVIQQTSLAPMTGLARQEYGRVLGVNTVYFLWALGFEGVWVVLLPVLLTELMFPERRSEPWLRKRGIAIAVIAFVLGAFVAWYSWTQQARPLFHLPPYRLSGQALAIALGATAVLSAIALTVRPSSRRRRRAAPSPWLAALVGFVLALPWFVLVQLALAQWPRGDVPFAIALAAGAAWAAGAVWLVRSWALSEGWRDEHRVAMAGGAIVASMAAGFVLFAVGGALMVDVAGKVVLDVAAVAVLVRLHRDVRGRASHVHPEARSADAEAGASSSV